MKKEQRRAVHVTSRHISDVIHPKGIRLIVSSMRRHSSRIHTESHKHSTSPVYLLQNTLEPVKSVSLWIVKHKDLLVIKSQEKKKTSQKDQIKR